METQIHQTKSHTDSNPNAPDTKIIRIGLSGYHHQSGAARLNPDLVQEINAGELVDLLLREEWKGHCEIIPNYMPPYPNATTRPKVVVRISVKGVGEHQEDCYSYLRHSAGPRQGFFWDCYGDDLMSVELAILALHQAPYPVHTGPIVFKIPLCERTETVRAETRARIEYDATT